MSRKSRDRLGSFREVVKKRPQPRIAPQPWTLKEKVQVWAAILGGIGAVTSGLLLSQSVSKVDDINVRVEEWTREFGFTREEAKAIKELELAFHHVGDLDRKSRSPADKSEKHQKELVEVVRRELAASFGARLNQLDNP